MKQKPTKKQTLSLKHTPKKTRHSKKNIREQKRNTKIQTHQKKTQPRPKKVLPSWKSKINRMSFKKSLKRKQPLNSWHASAVALRLALLRAAVGWERVFFPPVKSTREAKMCQKKIGNARALGWWLVLFESQKGKLVLETSSFYRDFYQTLIKSCCGWLHR